MQQEEKVLNRMKERLKMLILSMYTKGSELVKRSKKEELFFISSSQEEEIQEGEENTD